MCCVSISIDCAVAALTNQDGHKDATDSLLMNLLNLCFWAFGHDS